MSDVSDTLNRLEREAWELHKKLGDRYESTLDAYRDMAKLGQLGDKLIKLHGARAIINEVDAIYARKGS